MLASYGRRRCLNPGWTELWMNPCVDLLSCLISAFGFSQIPQPGERPFAVVVRDKPGHHAVFVSIQLESCRIRALISCSHNSAVVGRQGVKVASKPGRPLGLCSSEDRHHLCCMRSCCQCSCPAAGHQHIWEFQWAHKSSGRRDVIHLHNPALGCFPHRAVLPGPSDGAPFFTTRSSFLAALSLQPGCHGSLSAHFETLLQWSWTSLGEISCISPHSQQECHHPQDFLQLWECLPRGTCLHQSTPAQFELQFRLILLRVGNGCFDVWYLWTWKAPFLLTVHWAGQCLSLPIKNVIKDLASCKKCIKKTEKQCSRFLLALLLVCSGFYFCVFLSCLSQKNSHLNFPHVLTCLIAKHWALKTKQTKKSLHLIQTKYRLSLSSRTMDIGNILSAPRASRRITARKQIFQLQGKEAEPGKQLCPITPCPTAAS